MRVDYGVRALVELAEQYGRKSIQTVEIANRQNIPEPYLEQLLTTLGKFGLVKSRRGPHGGHVLAKAPDEISLGMVMVGLEGSTAPLDCIAEPAECSLSSNCIQREVWKSVEDAVQGVLGSTTIADLTNHVKPQRSRVAYQI
jgi:Rrf2 family protein